MKSKEQRYAQKMRDEGNVKISVWVPKELVQEYKDRAKVDREKDKGAF